MSVILLALTKNVRVIMRLADFATELIAENDFIKASFGGFAGSGKTRTASEFIAGSYKDMGLKKPVLLIDNEKGSRFLIPFFRDRGIQCLVKNTVHLADLLDAMDFLNSGDIDFLFVDSLTKIWYQYVRDYRQKNGNKKFMTLQDWGKILPAWQEDFSDKFIELNGSFVFTGRGGYAYAMEENEKGKKEFQKSGVKMKLAGETPFEPDLNIWMEQKQSVDSDGNLSQWREAQILKDRSAIIDGQTFKNPTYKDFQPVVKYLIDVEKGVVAGATNTKNLAPHEEWDDKRQQKIIVLEEINGELEMHYRGTGKAEKEAKCGIKKHVFGTYSDEQIQRMSIDDLNSGYKQIVELVKDNEKVKDIVKTLIENGKKGE